MSNETTAEKTDSAESADTVRRESAADQLTPAGGGSGSCGCGAGSAGDKAERGDSEVDQSSEHALTRATHGQWLSNIRR